MTYDTVLARRIRQIVSDDVRERPMFGALGFLVGGNLAVSASGAGGLMVRTDPAEVDRLVAEPHVSRFEMRGRRPAGWLHVDPEAVTDDADLRRWVGVGLAYARTLPPK